MSLKKNHAWALGGILIVCFAIAVGLWYAEYLTPFLQANCTKYSDSSCTLKLNNSPIGNFVIETYNEEQIQPFYMQLHLTSHPGLHIEHASVQLTGVNEYMGVNIYSLKQISDNLFKFSGVLPTCTSTKMQWHAQIMLTTNKGPVNATIEFTTIRNVTKEP